MLNTEIKKKKSIKCPCIINNEKCKEKISTIIGKCNYCNKVFCLKHRYPESHNCINLDKLKEKKHNINKDNLLGQKCNTEQVHKI